MESGLKKPPRTNSNRLRQQQKRIKMGTNNTYVSYSYVCQYNIYAGYLRRKRINSCHYSDECDASVLISTYTQHITFNCLHLKRFIRCRLMDSIDFNDLRRFIAITLISYHWPYIIAHIFELLHLTFNFEPDEASLNPFRQCQLLKYIALFSLGSFLLRACF